MNIIKIHGVLSSIFGKEIKVKLGNVNIFTIINALDSIKSGFRKKLIELFNQKKCYTFIQSAENKREIHIIPSIGGSGKAFKWIVLGVLFVIAVLLLVFAAPLGAALFGAAPAIFTSAAAATAFVTTAAVMIAITGITTFIQMSQMERSIDKMLEEAKKNMKDLATGGSVGTSPSLVRSYIFSGQTNVSRQGQLLPLGYGKYRLGSQVISIGVKNYSASNSFYKVTTREAGFLPY
jgi:predicted phage tail protein